MKLPKELGMCQENSEGLLFDSAAAEKIVRDCAEQAYANNCMAGYVILALNAREAVLARYGLLP